MFTSRAEFRLTLRADNADQRLTQIGIELGCVGELRRIAFMDKSAKLKTLYDELCELSFTPQDALELGIKVGLDGKRRSGFELLSLPDVSISKLSSALGSNCLHDAGIVKQLEADALYSNYIVRQERDIDNIKNDESHRLPLDFDYAALSGLSNELKSKLKAARPENLGQAGRIDGMTPAALSLILTAVQVSKKRSA
jgi:tRNA uridine 5-carboxymethylaminomethyl modification enzyme